MEKVRILPDCSRMFSRFGKEQKSEPEQD